MAVKKWIWRNFRDYYGALSYPACMTRLRSRSKLARPYICLLSILKVALLL